jgi:predicted glycosyltransferase
MRIWVDLTNSPHVLVMRPVIRALERRGATVLVTARDFAQTLGLCERLGIAHQSIGRHRGGRLAAKGLGFASRSLELASWARGRRFDAALGHGSNDVTVAATLLGIPSATTFDYEWAKVQHGINCRLARRVVVPDAIPPERLAPYGATARKLRRYPGLKEEYYLADFEPDAAVLGELGLDRAGPSRSSARRRRSRSTTASSTRCSPGCSSGCASRRRSSCSRARPSSAPSWRPQAATSCRSARSTLSR